MFSWGRDTGRGWLVCRTKPGGVSSMLGDAGAPPECKMKTLMTPDHIAFQVHRSWFGQSSVECLDTGHHEKTPVCCPCSRLAAFHGAPWTLISLMPFSIILCLNVSTK